MTTDKAPKYEAPFNTQLYSIHPDMAEVFKMSTGIVDDEMLKKHIINTTRDAFDRFPYPCFCMFTHLNEYRNMSYAELIEMTQLHRFPPTNLPSYDQIKTLGRHRKRHILLEVGSGFGTELRRLAFDGYPAKDMVAVDMFGGLWDAGYALFGSDMSSFPVKFIEGDIFDDSILSLNDDKDVSKGTPLDLESLESLRPLSGQVSVIFIQQVFHLFSMERQIELVRRLLKLIKLEPGSIICGRQGGSIPERNCRTQNVDHFLHSPDSWERMWEEVLPRSKAKYCTEFRPLPADIEKAYYALSKTTGYLTWSICIL